MRVMVGVMVFGFAATVLASEYRDYQARKATKDVTLSGTTAEARYTEKRYDERTGAAQAEVSHTITSATLDNRRAMLTAQVGYLRGLIEAATAEIAELDALLGDLSALPAPDPNPNPTPELTPAPETP